MCFSNVCAHNCFTGKESVFIANDGNTQKNNSQRNQESYDSMAKKVSKALDEKHSLTALDLADAMVSKAKADGSTYGQFVAEKAISEVYLARNNRAEAKKHLSEAINQAHKLGDVNIDFGTLYQKLGDLYMPKESAQALHLYSQGIEATKSERSKALLYFSIAKAYATLGDKDNFYKYSSAFSKVANSNGKAGTYKLQNTVLEAYAYDFAGNAEKAEETAKEISDFVSKHAFLSKHFVNLGDYKKAFKHSEKLKEYLDSCNRAQVVKDVRELSHNLETDNIARRTRDNELEITNMELAQIEKENELTQKQNEALKLEKETKEKEAHNISLRNRNQGRARQIEAIEMDRILAETTVKEQQLQYNIITLVVVLCLLIIIAAVLIFRTNKHRKHMARLQQLTDELRIARNDAVHASQMKNLFIQNMSHEIRTPLNAVMGFAQILGIPDLPLSDEEHKAYSNHIQNNAKMLTMLIDDILNISDIENGKYNIKISEHEVNDICRSAISSAEYRVQDGVQLYMTSDVDDSFTIMTDARRVQQVLINFLTNACKHTTEGSIHLHCSLTENPGLITFSVADTGCGIPKEQAENIFERFTKLDDFKQGTGLGLNICRLISNRLNGFVKCDTTYTNGARFVFAFPLTTNATNSTNTTNNSK